MPPLLCTCMLCPLLAPLTVNPCCCHCWASLTHGLLATWKWTYRNVKKGQFRNPSITTPPCAPGWIGQCPRTSTGLAPNAPYQPSSMSFDFEFNLFNNLHSVQELVSHWSHLNSDLKASWGHPAKRPLDATGQLLHLLYSDHIIGYVKKSSSKNQ